MSAKYDAILVPGGGILDINTPQPWVQKRLDRALEISQGATIITLSAGTTHKAPLLDEKGFPQYESRVSADYLIKKGYDPKKLLVEHHSYDTIGNAFFARMIHTEPLQLQNLAVVTSLFHMDRVKQIFDWIFALTPCCATYSLDYFSTENSGIPEENLASRVEGEQRRIRSLEMVQNDIITLQDFHRWFFQEHEA